MTQEYRKYRFVRKDYSALRGQAIRLRREGKSYGEIVKELEVGKSTIALWLRNSGEDFSGVKSANRELNQKLSGENLAQYVAFRKQSLFIKYDKAIKEAKTDFEKWERSPLFIVGLMLYAGEGDKTTRCHIRVSNSDFRIHRAFMGFMEKYLLFAREKFSFQVLGHEGDDREVLEGYWAEKLGVSREKFHKTQLVSGKSKKRLQFGTCMTIINNTRAKYKLLEWIDLALKKFN